MKTTREQRLQALDLCEPDHRTNRLPWFTHFLDGEEYPFGCAAEESWQRCERVAQHLAASAQNIATAIQELIKIAAERTDGMPVEALVNGDILFRGDVAYALRKNVEHLDDCTDDGPQHTPVRLSEIFNAIDQTVTYWEGELKKLEAANEQLRQVLASLDSWDMLNPPQNGELLWVKEAVTAALGKPWRRPPPEGT